MTLLKGYTCPSCNKGTRIMEIEDKSRPLYYSMQGAPIYAKKLKCGECGHEFDKP